MDDKQIYISLIGNNEKSILVMKFFLKLFSYSFFILILTTSFKCYSALGSETKIRFTENKGQIADQNLILNPDVLFIAQLPGFSFQIRRNGVSYQQFQTESDKNNNIAEKILNTYRTDLEWLGCNDVLSIRGINKAESVDNYYLQQCSQGITGVVSYEELIIENLYDGISLMFYSKSGYLKSDYFVDAGSDFSKIQFSISGSNVHIDSDGNLIYSSPFGIISEDQPIAIQDGKKLKASWVLKDGIVSISVDGYNPMLPMIIDPVTRLWGTYYGGSGGDVTEYCTVDQTGNIYFVGSTSSTNAATIATTGAHQQSIGGTIDGMIVKFDPDGNRIWATYYGGSGIDRFRACDVSSVGHMYVVGETTSEGAGTISTTGSYQQYFGGAMDAFVAKFDTSGVRIWGTYFGGATEDRFMCCSIDDDDHLYIAGITESTYDVSSPGAHQQTIGGMDDAFFTRFDTAGTLVWSTYYGGLLTEYAYACDTDNDGNVYFAGSTGAYPVGVISTPGSHQELPIPAMGNGFLTKFDSLGNRIWGTYYGPAHIRSLRVSTDGYLIFSGGTTGLASGTEIATSGSHQETAGGGGVAGSDAYLAKFDTSGTRIWATYYGGSSSETSRSCNFDNKGNIYLVGSTQSDDSLAISTIDGHQPNFSGEYDAYIAMFDSSGVRQWGTYYGGPFTEEGWGCAPDTSGNVYLLGFCSPVAEFGVISTPGAYQEFDGGGTDCFLVKFESSNGIAAVTEKELVSQNYIYPNPNRGSFSLNIDHNSTYEIYSVSGKLCQSGFLLSGSNSVTHNLVSGLYYFIYGVDLEVNSLIFIVE